MAAAKDSKAARIGAVTGHASAIGAEADLAAPARRSQFSAEQTSAMPEQLRHIPALDGVRGIAIALVLASHLTGSLRAPIFAPLNNLLGLGWAGVDLFFALSGYLITSILLNSSYKAGYFRDFYVKRALRIWPLYYVCVAVAFIALHYISALPAYRSLTAEKAQFGGDPVANVSYLPLYLLLVQNFLLSDIGGFSILAATWSLCVEEHFYLTWPLVIRFIRPMRAAHILLVLLAAEPVLRLGLMLEASRLPPGWPHWIIYHFTPFHLDGIAAGAALAILTQQGVLHSARIRRWAMATMASAGCAFLLLNVLPASDVAREVFSFTLLAIAAASLLYLVVRGGAHRFLTWPPLRYLGRISFGLYLLHDPIINILSSHSLMLRLGPRAPIAAVELLFATIALAVSVGVASLSREFFEERFLRLRKRFDIPRYVTR